MNDAKPEHLKTHFLPTITKLREKTEKVFQSEEALKKEFPMGGNEMEDAEFLILEVRIDIKCKRFSYLFYG